MGNERTYGLCTKNVKGGTVISKTKRLKWNNKLWNVRVLTYKNKRMCLMLYNKCSIKEITIDVNDAYLDSGHIFLDPESKENGILKVLKKSRIVRDITGTIFDNYVSIPVAMLNMGILKQYDYHGVMKHIDAVSKEVPI